MCCIDEVRVADNFPPPIHKPCVLALLDISAQTVTPITANVVRM